MFPTQSTKEKNIQHIPSSENLKIALRTYGLKNNGVPVILFHGLQSHSGWFTQSSDFIASLGYPVYAVDRPGSGLSDPIKDSQRNLRTFMDTVDTVATYAMSIHKKTQIHLLGHCLGALGAAGYACQRPQRLKSLLMTTSGVFTKTDVLLTDKIKILYSVISGKEMRIPIPLKPEQFSELDEYVEFIRQDKLSLHETGARFFWFVRQLRIMVKNMEDQLTMPVFMASAANDPICDNTKNKKFFDRLPSQKKVYKKYDRVKHILEFSPQRDKFFKDLKSWFLYIDGVDHG